MVPLVSAVAVRSPIGDAAHRRCFGLRCTRATVAAVFSPLKVPLIVRVLPFNVAVTAPEPAMVACIGDIDRHDRQPGAILRRLRVDDDGRGQGERPRPGRGTGHGPE